MHCLILEDDIEIAAITKKAVSELGFEIHVAHCGQQGLEQLQTGSYDLIILDLMLPKVNGFAILKTLRENKPQLPVLILSALNNVDDRVQGLTLGGDDYLLKPFSVLELQIRIKNLLKRSQKSVEATTLEFQDLKLNRLSRKVSREGKALDLHGVEYDLLCLFLRHPNQIVSKKVILKEIWNYDFDPQTNIVDVLICRLRSKLNSGFQSPLIQTVRGVGYILKGHNFNSQITIPREHKDDGKNLLNF